MDPAAHREPFSPRLEEALALALQAHAGQSRKGGPDQPYAVHPLHVAWMVRSFSDDEDVQLAALLHDVVEDSGVSQGELAARFGQRVAGMVAELSEDKRLAWRTRKELAIQGVPGLSPGAALVKACDKLHNLCTLAAELARSAEPDALWSRFNGGREGTLSVARRLSEALAGRVPAALAQALLSSVLRLERVAGAARQD